MLIPGACFVAEARKEGMAEAIHEKVIIFKSVGLWSQLTGDPIIYGNEDVWGVFCYTKAYKFRVIS